MSEERSQSRYRQPANATSTGLANSIVAATGVSRLFGFVATSTNVAAQFILVFDALVVPANTAVPIMGLPVPAAGFVDGDWEDIGRSFDHGIILCNSTTQGALTIGAADTIFDVQYVYEGR